MRIIVVLAVLAGAAFAQSGEDLVDLSGGVTIGPDTGVIRGGGQGLDGAGIGRDGQGKKKRSGKKDDDEEESYRNWLPCTATDLGTDALYKFPSHGTKDGIVFLPPKRVCHDEDGSVARHLSVNATHALLCATPFCAHKSLGFERIANCFPRTHEGPVRAKFKEGPLYVVLRLRDKRNLYWFIKDPYARNGAPPYPNLAHTVYPGCYRWR